MKQMPQIPEVQKSVRITTTFSGYNHKEVINDGEMYMTHNLSGDLYPVLSPRKKRGIKSYDVEGQDPVPLNGIHGRDKLVHIRGSQVYYNGAAVTGLTVDTSAEMLPKKIVSMGAYVCIWPDKKYFNTVDTTDYGAMYRLNETSGENLQAIMCRNDGTNYDMTDITVSDTPPDPATNGQLWMDQSGENDVLRQYNVNTLDWTEVPSVYVKIYGNGSIGQGFKEYDAVEISGMTTPDVEEPTDQDLRLKRQLESLNGSAIVYGAGDGYIIVAGLLSQSIAAMKDQTVSVHRKVPDLDFICESNNRLWGCKYGLEDGAVVNEIRASKLGDFRNWSCFMGLSTDSYTASIGTDGPWTGAISQRGYPVFLKENAIHRVSGNTPSSFSIQTTTARGVQEGCWRSLAVVGENIYYKSRDGVMLYDGNMPVSVGDQLGGIVYSDARAGALGDKYYISMKDTAGLWNLFTYDTTRGMWFREDDLHALGFGAAEDELYAIDEDHNTLVGITGSVGVGVAEIGETAEEDFNWSAEFGISGIEYTPTQYGKSRADMKDHHYVSRFDIRMYLEEESRAWLEIQYDSSGIWENKGEIRGKRMKTFVLPVIPKRCDHLRFRIRGKGDMRIYSIARYLEVGSDG